MDGCFFHFAITEKEMHKIYNVPILIYNVTLLTALRFYYMLCQAIELEKIPTNVY